MPYSPAISPLPAPLWGVNLRAVLTRTEWRKLREGLIAERGLKCETCGRVEYESKDIAAHEEWDYDTASTPAVAKLTGIKLSCWHCHAVEHFGATKSMAASGEVGAYAVEDTIEHFCRLNSVGRAEFEAHHEANPLGKGEGVVILSYDYAARIAEDIRKVAWDLVVFDEAHKLRNVYKAAETSRAAVLRSALADRQKLLLTATPLQNNLMELYGLVTVIDDQFFGSPDAFRAEFGGREDRKALSILGRRLEPICKRTLRRQVQKAGLINYTNRLPKTFDFTPDRLEEDLYKHMSDYLQREDTVAVGQNGRHLVTLVLRKILGSSSFAVAATLDKMVERLERRLSISEETLDDIDGVQETADEWREPCYTIPTTIRA